jgi:arylsulfatase A-like enzyme
MRNWGAFSTHSASGGWDDTLVVFTSDHGEMMGDHRMLGKGSLYPQSYHIPLVVKIPGGAKGQRVGAFTSAADVFPTVAELIGSVPRNALDGRSLTPLLTGGRPRTWRKAALWESDLRHVLDAPPPGHAPRDCVLQCRMDAGHLYVASPAWGPALFDLAEDPGCLHNRAADPALRAARLAAAEAMLADRAQAMDDNLARACVWNWHERH